MKRHIKLITIILFTSCITMPDYEIEKNTSKEYNAQILFETGNSELEKTIVAFNLLKINRLGITAPAFSHVKIIIGDRVWETHPRHGVLCNRFDGITEGRTFVDIWLPNIEDVISKLEHADTTANEYNFTGAAALGQYTLTGIYIGRSNPETYHCASLVAYAIGVKEWWKCDLVDLWILVNN